MSRIDYDLRLIEGIVFDVDGVLSPSTVPTRADGMPARMCNVKDGYALQLAVKKGLRIAIITGADDESIVNRARLLGIADVYMRASSKMPALVDWMSRRGVAASQVAYVGDDLPDLPPMRHVGLPACPADAVADVKAVSRVITKAAGGYGVARELLEEVLKAKSLWEIVEW